ncbi:MAG: hypothetical protein Q8K58_12170 [Acidimicrobiales bacterium]|nr:hypothetical protein [Acidimicrobiales bacterium]
MRRTLRPLAALAVVALIGAGCSDGSAEDASPGGSGATKSAAPRDRAVEFAECMRDNGVSAFPDPSASGDQELVAAIERLDPGSAAFRQAISACKELQPPGLLGGRASPQEMSARLEFAQCMRDNGVGDFPDPANGEPLIDTNRIPSAAGRGARSIPGFQAAMEQCRDVMADALGGR